MTKPKPQLRLPLTERQREVLSFIEAEIKANGYPPSVREIGRHFLINSNNGVCDHLHALQRKGAIRWDPMKNRTIQVLQPSGDEPTPIGMTKLIDFRLEGDGTISAMAVVEGMPRFDLGRMERLARPANGPLSGEFACLGPIEITREGHLWLTRKS